MNISDYIKKRGVGNISDNLSENELLELLINNVNELSSKDYQSPVVGSTGVSIQQAYYTSTQWYNWNGILKEGQKGIESDTGKEKTGDGVTTWRSLPYDTLGLDLDSKEDKSNKSSSTSLGESNTLYPTQKAVKTYADTKFTDSMSTNKLLGRGTAGTGSVEEITLGTNLSLTGTTLNAAGGSGGYTIVSKSIDYTASSGELVTCDVSGGSITIDLPASPSADDFVAVQINTNGTSNTVTVDRNGNTINGAASNQTLYLAGDILYFYWNDTDSTWIMNDSGLIPHSCKLRRSAAQSITVSTNTKVLVDASEYDYGELGDITTNNRIDIRRTGLYDIGASWAFFLAAARQIIVQIRIDGTTAIDQSITSGANATHVNVVHGQKEISAGSYLELRVFQSYITGNTLTGTPYVEPAMWVSEIR